MKALKLFIAASLLFVVFGSVNGKTTAAELVQIPEGAVINPESNNAYHLDRIGLSIDSLEIIDAINAKKPLYFKLPGSNSFYNLTSGSMVSASVIDALPSLTYTDKNGNKQTIPSNNTVATFEVLSID